MKTLRVSDQAHRVLTRLLDEMMAETGRPATFSDVIEALVSRFVLLPAELIRHMDEFTESNKQLGYTTREEFIREAVVEKLSELSEIKKVARTRKQKNEESGQGNPL